MFGDTTVAYVEGRPCTCPEKCMYLGVPGRDDRGEDYRTRSTTLICLFGRRYYRTPPRSRDPDTIIPYDLHQRLLGSRRTSSHPCCGHMVKSTGTVTSRHWNAIRYDWHGFCNYTLVSLDATDRAPSAAVFAEMKRVGPCATVFDSVTFHNDPHTIINLTRDANNKSQRTDRYQRRGHDRSPHRRPLGQFLCRQT
uniref:Ovary protein n=1 Tax=Eriocheir sinensis TaxID=95602 RepID=Q5QKQ8_ERISI|nr:ovary protein [Eriocheir sinensis]